MPRNSGKHLVRITWIDSEPGNLLAIAEAKMRPGFARVSRLVNAIADREIRPMQPFSAGNINNIRIRRRNGNRANGARWLIVKDRLPGAAVVVGLPDPAIAHANIEDAGLAGHAGNGTGASPTERADGSPVEGGEQRGIKLGKGSGLGGC